MAKSGPKIDVESPPFETEQLRKQLALFLSQLVEDPVSKGKRPLGNFKWGVYAFYDYDGEPIYIGQTNEQLRTRIGRHLTNQRTDAVAMSVLDPFEVCEIAVWPLPLFQSTSTKKTRTTTKEEEVEIDEALAFLNALEYQVYEDAIARSRFAAVLNEKDPVKPHKAVKLPKSYRGTIVSDEVMALRAHPDLRIARRALIISRLAQVISERKVQGGLRRVLVVQAKRLAWLAEQRFASLGGQNIVGVGDPDADSEQ
jgi:hypothetical protein